jgi:Fic family protein
MLARAIMEASDDSVAIALDLVELAGRWERQLARFRSHSATRRLPRFLLGHPVLSVQQAATGLGISQPAANAALNNLLAEGIVTLANERQWGRVFQATEILQRLDRPPG